MTLKKKQSDSDFIKSLPSHPSKEFEIQRRLDNLRGINRKNNNNNNNDKNNNNNRGNSNIFDGGDIPSLPELEDFIDGGVSPFNTLAQNSAIIAQQNADRFQNRLTRERQRELSNIPKETVKTDISNLFDGLDKPSAPTLNFLDNIGSWPPPPPQPASAGVATKSIFDTEKKTKTQQDVDDFLYQIPDKMPELVPGDGILTSSGTEAEGLFNSDAPPSKKEEEDEILKKTMDEYQVEKIRGTKDEKGAVAKSIYFSYGGNSELFNSALEFLGLSPINRECGAFLLSDLGLKTNIQNKLRIHVGSGDIFYNNHNTGENFYSFLLSQQNDEAAYVPKKWSYSNSFEEYISKFLQQFSIGDQEKFDLLSFKNSKYLFYRFNDFMKAYGNPRYKLLHTKKMLDTVNIKKIEEKNKQFLIEKLFHSVEFEDLYATNPEKKNRNLTDNERKL